MSALLTDPAVTGIIDSALLREVIDQLPSGLAVFDGDDRLMLANARFRELWSLPADLARPGVAFADILAHAGGSETVASRGQPVAAPAGHALPPRREWRLADGRVVQAQLRRRADGRCIALHDDVTLLRRSPERVGDGGGHDALTGLLARPGFVSRLQQARSGAGADAEQAVLIIDLDRFKPVNDAWGHARGDELLCRVAQRLSGCVRDGDVLGRLGGDEFAVLQAGGGQPQSASALARRLIATLAEPFDLDGHRVHIGCSVGVALAPFDGDDAETLLHRADLAMLRAKADGRGVHRFYEPGLEAAQRARRELEADLHEALAQGAFTLAYQPQVDIVGGTVTGVEALLRWTHPTRGIVSPAEFVPVAEETGLIVPLGRWVLERACQEARHWPVRVAVNVSGAQFRHGQLLADVWAALAASGLPPERLEIEITESVMLDDPEQVVHTLRALRERGVRVAMDDFGTGYSSLSTLRSFPFDRLKIDRSFVRDAETRQDLRAIIGAVLMLGRQLGMATTVEGVETPSQLGIVEGEGCREVQGFLFSRPQPADAIPALIEALEARARAARPGAPNPAPGGAGCSTASST